MKREVKPLSIICDRVVSPILKPTPEVEIGRREGDSVVVYCRNGDVTEEWGDKGLMVETNRHSDGVRVTGG